ncbi:hypothetical protein TSUD_157910 [Trifolium subterraneum]|uniref:HXXXD-type acyl-transferase family protein n=1 Tax=Trifolium subterraneum TaxID=3900 RepID=A0A2Z6NQZ8_TRISU|nr:hypothetical protein TSUD_157910 [Trifolium subterraneum]
MFHHLQQPWCIVAIAENTTIADITQPKYVPPIVHSLFPLNRVKNYEGTTQPVLAVQVTELIDGIFIGFAINHVVADGKSFWLFVNSWAEISRGFNKPTKIPSFKRWSPNDINHPIQQREVPPLRIFHFTKEKVAQLKSKANAEIGNSDKTIIISSLQALITHIWRSIVRGVGVVTMKTEEVMEGGIGQVGMEMNKLLL